MEPTPRILVGLYAIYLGLRAARLVGHKPSLADSPFECGRWLGRLCAGLALVVGGAGVLAGFSIAAWLLVVFFIAPIPRVFKHWSTGFAEGRKSAALASSIEYVQGRTQPTLVDNVVAVVVVTASRGIPAAILVFDQVATPR